MAQWIITCNKSPVVDEDGDIRVYAVKEKAQAVAAQINKQAGFPKAAVRKYKPGIRSIL